MKELFPCAHRDNMRLSGGVAPPILQLGTRWRWVIDLMEQLPYPWGNDPQQVRSRRLGGPHSQCRNFVEEIKSFVFVRNRSRIRQVFTCYGNLV